MHCCGSVMISVHLRFSGLENKFKIKWLQQCSPLYLFAATRPLPENNTAHWSYALPLFREPKVVDESRQSREDVEATVLTAITGIGADSLGACASPPSLSVGSVYVGQCSN